MASVLVVAVDPAIEALVGELVAFAGHLPLFDATLGVAGECIRRLRPDICMLDSWLSRTVLDHCFDASEEVGARPVLISGTAMEYDLAECARGRHCLHFDLPGGPKLLAAVLQRALSDERPAALAGHAAPQCANVSPVHPALCAAIASVARARVLMRRAGDAISTNRELRDRLVSGLEEARRSRDGLRAAVADYASHLKAKAVPADRMIDMVTTALADCAAVVGAEEAAALVAADSRRWALEVYDAA